MRRMFIKGLAATLLSVVVAAPAAQASTSAAVQPGYTSTLNRAGYAVDGSGVHQVSARWIQPRVKCGATTTYVNFMVGLSRAGVPIAQAGTAADCHNGHAFAYGWIKLPGESRQKLNPRGFPVEPGDAIRVDIHFRRGGHTVMAHVWNPSQGWGAGLGIDGTFTGTRGSVVMQARSGAHGVLPLTPSHVVFNHAQVDDQFLTAAGPLQLILENARDVAKPGPITPIGRFDVYGD